MAEVPLDAQLPALLALQEPDVFRATEQWFIALDQDGLRQQALDAIRERGDVDSRRGARSASTTWWRTGPTGSSRASACGACRSSRSTARAATALLLDEALIEHVAGILATGAGADEWYARDAAELLPAGHALPASAAGADFRKETDILDVWFDSGCSHAAVLETRPELRWPAELYLEGSDQHRGWFHSSLLEAVGTRDAPPYQTVLTHGFVVDGEGRKMSKSRGNNVAPDELIPKYGAEVLRLWVAAEDYPRTSASPTRS